MARSSPHHHDDLRPEAADFYREVMSTLNRTGHPYLIGGAFALTCYTGVCRFTKDLDLFVCRDDIEAMLETLSAAGFKTKVQSPLWIAKILRNGESIDLIFNSGNGLSQVDASWFEKAQRIDVLGIPSLVCPPEEFIWSKAFIMERERYDGADVAHVLRAQADTLDWEHLLELFGPYWRVLFSHLVLFGFVYPGERERVPDWVMGHLVALLEEERSSKPDSRPICRGTLISRTQYRIDVEEWGYIDARVVPLGSMTPEQALCMSMSEDELAEYEAQKARESETPAVGESSQAEAG